MKGGAIPFSLSGVEGGGRKEKGAVFISRIAGERKPEKPVSSAITTRKRKKSQIFLLQAWKEEKKGTSPPPTKARKGWHKK